MNPDGSKRIMDPSKIECKDKNADCSTWASWKSKECETNRIYMEENCPRSCGMCKQFGSISGDEL